MTETQVRYRALPRCAGRSAGLKLTAAQADLLRTLCQRRPDATAEELAALFTASTGRPLARRSVAERRRGWALSNGRGRKDPTPAEIAARAEALRDEHRRERESRAVGVLAVGRAFARPDGTIAAGLCLRACGLPEATFWRVVRRLDDAGLWPWRTRRGPITLEQAAHDDRAWAAWEARVEDRLPPPPAPAEIAAMCEAIRAERPRPWTPPVVATPKFKAPRMRAGV